MATRRQTDVDLRAFGGALHASWGEPISTGDEIFRAELSAVGVVVGAPSLVIDAPGNSRFSAIAGNASGSAVAFHNDRNGTIGVFVRFDDLTELEVDPSPAVDGDELAMAKASSSDVYAIVWDGTDASGVAGDVEYALVSPVDGILARGALTVEPENASAHPAVVWADGAFVAVWESRVATTTVDNLALRRIVP